jgi:hypothetical protein
LKPADKKPMKIIWLEPADETNRWKFFHRLEPADETNGSSISFSKNQWKLFGRRKDTYFL